MAGRPGRRAKQQLDAINAAGIDVDALAKASPDAVAAARAITNAAAPAPSGVESLNATHQRADARAPARARAHAHAREAPRAQPKAAPLGAATRNQLDQRLAGDIAHLASQLRTGHTLRLERLRPTWAAGWVGEIMIDDHDVGGLMEYIAQEHGGQQYRGVLVNEDDVVLLTVRIPIAGPPRRRGRETPRHIWEGVHDERATTTHATMQQPTVVQASPSIDVAGLAGAFAQIVTAIGGIGGRGDHQVLDAVREMATQSQQSNRELVNAVLTARTQDNNRQTLATQLQDFKRTANAIEEIREVFGAADGGGAPPQENDPMAQVASTILMQGLQNDRGRAPAQPNAQPKPQGAPNVRPMTPRQQVPR
jgi:hypothetical protein